MRLDISKKLTDIAETEKFKELRDKINSKNEDKTLKYELRDSRTGVTLVVQLNYFEVHYFELFFYVANNINKLHLVNGPNSDIFAIIRHEYKSSSLVFGGEYDINNEDNQLDKLVSALNIERMLDFFIENA